MNGQGNDSALTSSRLRWVVLFSVTLLALLVGGWLRCCNLRESLWIDELHTSWTVKGSWSELVDRAAWGNQPPLYFGITKTLTLVAEDREATLRFPSLLAGCAMIALGSLLVYLITGQASGAAVAAWLLALDIELVFYAQEARPYALVQLLLLMHVLLFVRRLPLRPFRTSDRDDAHANPKRARMSPHDWPIRVAWVVTLWLAFYCHYTALLILAWEFGVALGLAMLKPTWRRSLGQFVIDTGVIVIGLLPAAWHVVAIAQRQSDWSVLVQLWPLPRQVAQAIVMYVFPSLVIALVAWRWQRRDMAERKSTEVVSPGRDTKSFVTLWGASWVLVIALLWVGSRWLGVAWFLPRYFIGLWPLIVLLPAFVIACVPPGIVRTMGIVLLFFIVVIENPMLNARVSERCRPIERGENWRDAIAALAESDRTVHTLFLFPNLVEDKRLENDPSDDFVAYLEFPVRARYELPTENREREWDLVVRSLQGNPILRQSDIERMLEDRHFRILLRGQPQDVEGVLQALAAGLAPHDLTFDALVDGFGSVFVVDVTVLSPEALKQRESNRQPD